MKEKKINRWLLYMVGFLCGHSAVFGMTPFLVPMLAAVYRMRRSTFGLCLSMLAGGATLIFEQGISDKTLFLYSPYVAGWKQTTVWYFLSKYGVILVLLLCSWSLFGGILRKRASGGRSYGFGRRREEYAFGSAGFICMCGVLVWMAASVWGLALFGVWEALLLGAVEACISAGMIPAFSCGLRVLLIGEQERDRENEELLGILAVTAVCFWSMPVTIGGVVTWTATWGLYISWYTLHRFGAGYGMAVTGVCGLLTTVKLARAELVGGYFLVAVGVLLGRTLSNRKKAGTILAACVTSAAVGYLYDDYFLTGEGVKTVLSAAFLFAATPGWMLSARDGWAKRRLGTQTAVEINRMTAEKIREMAGALKRIEYTLAGCGPAAGKVNLGEIGEMIGRFSDNLDAVEAIPVGKEDRLRSEFVAHGVELTQIVSMKNEMGRRQYYITARTLHRKILLTRDAAELMSGVLGTHIRVSKDAPAIISENERVISFEECASFRCMYYVRRIKKYGSNVSGDNFSVKELENGHLVMMISDGMGSGSLASCESTLMIDTMEEMLAAGFDPSYGIAFSNRCISEKNSGRCFTTFDMGMVDLYSGAFTQYKQGAAPTYVVHEKGAALHTGYHEAAASELTETGESHKKGQDDAPEVVILRGSSLPIGVLPEAECDVKHETLADGDAVVMMSDGVTLGENEMMELLAACSEEEPEEILDRVVTDVLTKCAGKLADDVTVIVAKLFAA